MKQHKIYFYNYGENSYTAMTPCRPAQPEDGDTYDTRCIAYDNDGLVTVKERTRKQNRHRRTP